MSEDALRNTIEIQAEVLKERNELVQSLIKTQNDHIFKISKLKQKNIALQKKLEINQRDLQDFKDSHTITLQDKDKQYEQQIITINEQNKAIVELNQQIQYIQEQNIEHSKVLCVQLEEQRHVETLLQEKKKIEHNLALLQYQHEKCNENSKENMQYEQLKFDKEMNKLKDDQSNELQKLKKEKEQQIIHLKAEFNKQIEEAHSSNTHNQQVTTLEKQLEEKNSEIQKMKKIINVLTDKIDILKDDNIYQAIKYTNKEKKMTTDYQQIIDDLNDKIALFQQSYELQVQAQIALDNQERDFRATLLEKDKQILYLNIEVNGFKHDLHQKIDDSNQIQKILDKYENENFYDKWDKLSQDQKLKEIALLKNMLKAEGLYDDYNQIIDVKMQKYADELTDLEVTKERVSELERHNEYLNRQLKELEALKGKGLIAEKKEKEFMILKEHYETTISNLSNVKKLQEIDIQILKEQVFNTQQKHENLQRDFESAKIAHVEVQEDLEKFYKDIVDRDILQLVNEHEQGLQEARQTCRELIKHKDEKYRLLSKQLGDLQQRWKERPMRDQDKHIIQVQHQELEQKKSDMNYLQSKLQDAKMLAINREDVYNKLFVGQESVKKNMLRDSQKRPFTQQLSRAATSQQSFKTTAQGLRATSQKSAQQSQNATSQGLFYRKKRQNSFYKVGVGVDDIGINQIRKIKKNQYFEKNIFIQNQNEYM